MEIALPVPGRHRRNFRIAVARSVRLVEKRHRIDAEFSGFERECRQRRGIERVVERRGKRALDEGVAFRAAFAADGFLALEAEHCFFHGFSPFVRTFARTVDNVHRLPPLLCCNSNENGNLIKSFR